MSELLTSACYECPALANTRPMAVRQFFQDPAAAAAAAPVAAAQHTCMYALMSAAESTRERSLITISRSLSMNSNTCWWVVGCSGGQRRWDAGLQSTPLPRTPQPVPSVTAGITAMARRQSCWKAPCKLKPLPPRARHPPG